MPTVRSGLNSRRASFACASATSTSCCAACTIGCEHIYALGKSGVRLEYESLFALGSLCGVGDGAVVLRASQRCDELGIDTISTGGTIAFAMECAERGWLDTFLAGDAFAEQLQTEIEQTEAILKEIGLVQ